MPNRDGLFSTISHCRKKTITAECVVIGLDCNKINMIIEFVDILEQNIYLSVNLIIQIQKQWPVFNLDGSTFLPIITDKYLDVARHGRVPWTEINWYICTKSWNNYDNYNIITTWYGRFKARKYFNKDQFDTIAWLLCFMESSDVASLC